MHHHPRFGAGLRSWFAYGLVALGASACTALLGDFEVASGNGANTDGGNNEGGSVDGGENPGGGDAPMVSPETIKVGVERPVAFNASGLVTWSVLEPNGGTIDATGHYASPATPGEYHVVATSTADPSLKGQATVNVVDLQLEVVAGPAAGQGNVDGLVANAHFNRPAAMAFSPGRSSSDPRRFFIADTGSHTIRMSVGNMVTTLAGSPGQSGNTNAAAGADARFDNPGGIEFAPTLGKVLVADTQNHCIRTVDPVTGATETFAGLCGTGDVIDGTAPGHRMTLPSSLLLSKDEKTLFVCTALNGPAMRTVDMATKAIATYFPLPGGLPMNSGCALGTNEWNGGQNNRIFFGGAGDGILRSLLTTKSFSEQPDSWVALPAAHVDGFASDIGSGGNKSIYVSVGNSHAIYETKFDNTFTSLGAFQVLTGDPAQTSDIARNGTMSEARWGNPRSMLMPQGSSELLVVDEGASAIRRINYDQNTVTDFIGKAVQYGHNDGSRSAARFALATGVTIGPDTAYITDSSSDGGRTSATIRAINLSTGVVTTVSGVVGRHPTAEDGVKTSAKFRFPIDLVKDGESLYVVDAGASAVRKVAISDGQVTTIAGSLNVPGDSLGTGIAAQFKLPMGIASDGNGNLYVSDALTYKIKKIVLATGAVTLFAGSTKGASDGPGTSAQFMSPSGLTVVGDSLFVADGADHTIRQVKLDTAEVTTLVGLHGQPGFDVGGPASAKLFGPTRLASDGIGGLYITEGTVYTDDGPELDKGFGGTIRRIDIATRTVRPFFGRIRENGLVPGPLVNARANKPFGIATTPAGDVVFTDLDDYSVGFIKPL